MERSEITFNIFKKVTKDDWFLMDLTLEEFKELPSKTVVKIVNDAIKNPGTWVNGITVGSPENVKRDRF